MNETRRRICTALKENRKIAGYKSAKAFAAYVQIPASRYTDYEQGRSRLPVEVAWVIADALGVTIDELVGREFTPKSSKLTTSETRLVDAYRRADVRGKGDISRMAETLSPETESDTGWQEVA